MNQDRSSRRKFIASAAFTGLAGILWPGALSANEDAGAFIDVSPEQKNLVFLFQGDSITDGNRGRNEDPNHVMGHGYAFAVASRVGADFPADGFKFFNRGISGNKIPDLRPRWQVDTLDIKAGLLSVLIGINDAGASVDKKVGAQTVAEFETGYRELLSACKVFNPNIIFVLGLPFVYPIGKRKDNWELWKDETLQRAAAVRKLANEFNAILVDYPAVFDKAIQKAPAEYWIWDGIHPTVFGHELMAREWINQVSTRLKFLKKYSSGKNY